jgi:DNA polymerase family A
VVEKEIRKLTGELLGKAGVDEKQLTDSTFKALLEKALAKTGRKVPLKQGKRGLIPATAKTDREMQAFLDDDDPAVAALVAVRLQKKGEEQKLARLATLRAIAQATGGVLPPFLNYCGSSTGRFAGGGKFNVQTLYRSGVGIRIRELLIPREGKMFVVGDLAQIEARVTAFLAGEDAQLSAFRDKRDIYSEHASGTLHCEVRKPTDNDNAELKARLTSYREVGQRAVLGLGFGMGALKFMNSLRSNPEAAHLFDTGELSPAICRNIVMDYRSRYRCIAQFWKDLEAAARTAAEGSSSSVGMLRFDRSGDITRIWLPSGRALRYANLRLDDTQRAIRFLDEFGEEREFTPTGPTLVYGNGTVLYGGKICENVVQAVARDLLVEAVLRVEDRGLPVLFHVHDEVVVEVDGAAATEAVHTVEKELSCVPPWAAGLPISCEVKTVSRYGK